MIERTPWRAMLAAALCLGITPDRFWRLSLVEWRALTAPAPEALPRTAFDALSSRFPDTAQ